MRCPLCGRKGLLFDDIDDEWYCWRADCGWTEWYDGWDPYPYAAW